MAEDHSIFPLGDEAITFSLAQVISAQQHAHIMSMKHYLEAHAFFGMVDIVTGYSSLTILYDPYVIKTSTGASAPYEWVRTQLIHAHEAAVKHSATGNGVAHRIPVCYEEMFSPDMDFICESNRIDREEVIRLHTGRTYTLYMIGFLPGFPYLAEVDARIAVPRKPRPRSRVPAGSVGIAGIQTGIYPVDSPGGWQIIGRTPVKMFDPHADPPVPFEAGDSISFYSITREAFEKLAT